MQVLAIYRPRIIVIYQVKLAQANATENVSVGLIALYPVLI